MKLAWFTDIHLNFLQDVARKQFYQDIVNSNCDAILITGDIAEAPSLTTHLQTMATSVAMPIYFVLGNHDYYRGQVSEIRSAMIQLTKSEQHLFWLPASGPQLLENRTILLGQDGWADGRYGNFANSRVSLNDSRLIVDLFQERLVGRSALLDKMQQLADADAAALHNELNTAIKQHDPKQVIILTHVPPFKEACLYENKISGDDYLPYFGSKSTGDVLLMVAKSNPAIEFIVLCGHTHHDATCEPAKNLKVRVGQAEYGKPQLQEILVY